MTRIEKAAQSVAAQATPNGRMAERLLKVLSCSASQFTEKDIAEVAKYKVAIPTDLLVAFGALFLLGTQERGYQMMNTIEQAADFATLLRDTIEDQTGELW